MENNKRTTIDVPQLVRDTIERHDLVENGDHIVCGLSGGPDSVCLFHILSELSDEMGFTLSAVHVNHGFRPGAADEDQQYVRELCARLGIPLTVKAVDVTALAAERGETPEEAGRAVRYEAFAEEARRWETAQDQKGDGSTVRIAVAHNRNDQAETVLMRLIRGTGTDGLAGMPYRRRDEYGYEIIRPLLDADRTEIEAYCAGHDLRPCRDHTNDEPKYFRNSVRLKLLPFLTETFGPNIPDALLRLAANAAEDKGYFAAVVEEAIDEFADFGGGETGGYKTESAAPGVSFPLEILRGIHPAVRRRLITALFAEIGLVQDIEAVHLAAADALIEKGGTGKSLDFPGGYRLEISYGNAVFAQRNRPPVQNCIQNCTKEPSPCVREYTDDSGRRVLEARAGDATALFDAAALNAAGLTPEWRTRRDGDFMRPKGMDGTKKLQDIFTDKKVPRADRDAIMLLAAGSEILWIPNIRISREYIIT